MRVYRYRRIWDAVIFIRECSTLHNSGRGRGAGARAVPRTINAKIDHPCIYTPTTRQRTGPDQI